MMNMTHEVQLSSELEEVDDRLKISREETARLEAESLRLFVPLLLDEILARQISEGWPRQQDALEWYFSSGHLVESLKEGTRFHELNRRILGLRSRNPFFLFSVEFNKELQRRGIPHRLSVPRDGTWYSSRIVSA